MEFYGNPMPAQKGMLLLRQNFVHMKMKLVLLIAGSLALFLSSCKPRPDQNLVNSMKTDIAKYEPGPAFLLQAGKEYSDMANLLLKLPEDVKSKIPYYNEEEAMTWKRYGAKLEGGGKAYTETLAKLKLLTADYLDGLVVTDSARVRYQSLISGLEGMPGPDRINPELNSARGSYQQMTAGIPADILTEFKAEAAKEDK